MNPGLKLEDIQGLDAIPWWPLAIGWWVVIGFLAVGGALLLLWRWQRNRRRGWQYQAKQTLRRLEKELSLERSQETVRELSAWLRRMAIHRYSRNECAGLQGEAWLQWLTDHDPKHFNWRQNARCLTESPFAPTHSPIALTVLRPILAAAKGWVK